MTGSSTAPLRTIAYDLTRFDFAGLLQSALGTKDLTALHADTAGDPGWSIYKVMEQSASYGAWWDLTGSDPFAELYARFVRTVIHPLFDEPVLVQSCPTPRIVYADQAGEPRFHRDADYGHHPSEVNFQVALTPSFATNAMWIESAPGLADYRPAELVPGEMLIFDGANLVHGAMPNTTGKSRVSFDFRAIRRSDATEDHLASAADSGQGRGAHVFADFGG